MPPALSSRSDVTLVLMGCGGHARSVADVAVAAGWTHIVFLDAAARRSECILGYPVVTTLDQIGPSDYVWLPCAGDNLRRRAQLEEALVRGYSLATIGAPSATIGRAARIGPGTFIGHHAHVGPEASIGRGVILNSGAIVEHEGRVGDFSHVSVNSVVAGRSSLGGRVFLGAGAVVIDGVSICDDVIIGAGATVISDIAAPGAYAGVPARLLRSR